MIVIEFSQHDTRTLLQSKYDFATVMIVNELLFKTALGLFYKKQKILPLS